MVALNDVKILSTDILIIGGGTAGLTAAIMAREQGAEVIVVDKMGIGWAGELPMGGGRIMMILPEDDLDGWVRWAVEEGGYLNDQAWTYALGGDIYQAVQALVAEGIPLTRDGQLEFVTKPWPYRVVQFDPLPVMPRMMKVAKGKGVKMVDRVALADLVYGDGQVAGALGVGITDGQPYLFQSKAVLIASGACRYKVSTSDDMCTGEGIAMAYRAGAQLRNAEFATRFQVSVKGTSVRAPVTFHNFYVNRHGERVVAKHFPPQKKANGPDSNLTLEDPNRTVEAVAKELLNGNGPVQLDLTRLTPGEREFAMGRLGRASVAPLDFFSTIKDQLGIDLFTEKAEVVPRFSGGQGAVRVDLACRTTVQRLWAAGDACALGSGWSGAVSPGHHPGVGIPFAWVSGHRAGLDVAEFIRSKPSQPRVELDQVEKTLQRVLAPLGREKGPGYKEIVHDIHAAVVPLDHSYFRSESKLNEALGRLEEARAKLTGAWAPEPHQLARLIEADAMLQCSEILLRSSLLRTESRSSFKRQEYPHRNDANWLQWTITQRQDDHMRITTQPVPLAAYTFRPA